MPKSKAQAASDAAVVEIVDAAVIAMRESQRFGIPMTKEKRAFARGEVAASIRALSLMTGEPPLVWMRRITAGAEREPH